MNESLSTIEGYVMCHVRALAVGRGPISNVVMRTFRSQLLAPRENQEIIKVISVSVNKFRPSTWNPSEDFCLLMKGVK